MLEEHRFTDSKLAPVRQPNILPLMAVQWCIMPGRLDARKLFITYPRPSLEAQHSTSKDPVAETLGSPLAATLPVHG